jgi:hypothetical protein
VIKTKNKRQITSLNLIEKIDLLRCKNFLNIALLYLNSESNLLLSLACKPRISNNLNRKAFVILIARTTTLLKEIIMYLSNS